MIVNNIDIGQNELFTVKNFNFDIVNSGTADLQIINIVTTNNIEVDYINFPFLIIINSTYNFSGNIKILELDSTGLNYIDFYIVYNNGDEDIHDVYRYYINYSAIIYDQYTEIIKINNINYIDNSMYIYFDLDETVSSIQNFILLSIDDNVLNIFPIIYKISNNKIIFLFKNNMIQKKVINDNIKFLILSTKNDLELKKIMFRII